MKVLKKIDIYLVKKRNTRPIEIVQADTGIQIEFTVKDFEIPTGTTATLFVQKPSGKFVYQETGITINGNVITINLENQAIIEKGSVPYQVTLKNGTDEITTFEGLMMVNRSLKNSDGTESKTVIKAFEALTAEKIAEIKASATAQIALVVAEGNNQIKAVQNASHDEQVAIEDKGAEVLATIPEDYQTTYNMALENKRLKAPAIIQTATGSEVVITDGADNLLTDFELHGKTEQESTKGYQLFDASKLPTKSAGGATVTSNGDGSFTVSGSGTLSEGFTTNYVTHDKGLLKEGNIRLYCGALTHPFVNVFISSSGGSLQLTNSFGVAETKKLTSEILNGNNFYISVGFIGNVNATIAAGTIKPMLYQDGDGTWEKFTNGASPNPDYPQAIENVGDCVEMIVGAHDSYTGKYLPNHPTYLTNKNSIPCDSGDTINLNVNDANCIKTYVFYYNDSGFVSQDEAESNNGTFTAPSGATYFHAECKFNYEITPQTVGKITLTVNGKHVVKIVEHGKNLLGDVTRTTNATFDSTKGVLKGTCTYNNSVSTGVKIQTYKNDTFVAHIKDTIKNGKYIYEFVKDNTFNRIRIGANGSDSDETAEFNVSHLTDGATYYVQMNVDTLVANGNTISNIMITINPEYDEVYVPYQEEKVATIFLNEPLREGDRLVKVDGVFKENHKRTKKVFNGSENWGLGGKAENGYQSFYVIEPTKAMVEEKDKTDVASDRFTPTTAQIWNNPSGYYTALGVGDHNIFIVVKTTDASTVDELKTWLSEHPTTIEYPLAEETLTPLDNASQIALNGLETFYPYTRITNSGGANMVIDYVTDTKMYIDNKFAQLAAQIV